MSKSTLPPDFIETLAKECHGFAVACHRTTDGVDSRTISGAKAAAFDRIVILVECLQVDAVKKAGLEVVAAVLKEELNELGTGVLSDYGHYRREELCDAYKHVLNALRRKRP